MKRRAPFKPGGLLALDAAAWGLDFAICGEDAPASFETAGGVAVVDVRGPLMRSATWMWDSYEAISGRVSEALASPCHTLMLRLDSPGGEAAGVFELSDDIRAKASAAGKRVIAYVDAQAASAAYAIACAADEIFIPPTGSVGSIGCVKMLVDQTIMDRAMGLSFAAVVSGARKADGNPHVPLTEGAIAATQGEVDAMADLFFDLVARARGLEVAEVEALQAAQFTGAAAVGAKLADVVATFDQALAMVASGEAREGAEKDMNEKEKAIAALKAIAAGDDEKEAKMAKAALAAMGEGDGEEKAEGDDEKPKDEPDGDEKAEGDDEKPAAEGDDEKPKDEDPKAAAAFAPAAKVLALESTVNKLVAKIEAKEKGDERAKLLATRPDLAPDMIAVLRTAPLATVRNAVKTLAKGPGPGAGQVAAARAALTATPTRGTSQSDAGGVTSAQSPEAVRALDEQMGLAPPTAAIRHDGNRLVLGVMTPSQARAHAAQKGAGK